MSNLNDQDFWGSLVKRIQDMQKEKFIFLLIGRTGVGKSSTINSLMGKYIAEVGDYKPTTMEIKAYESKINGINFKIFDTPGLCDELEEMGNDEKYLRNIRLQIKEIDSICFVSRLDDTRVGTDEKKGIKLISGAFGAGVWQQAIIIFTYANSVEKKRYKEALDMRTELIRREIAKYTGAEVANNIPSVAVDNKNETTPDGEEWLGELFTKVFLRSSERGLIPLLIGMVDSIRPPVEETGKVQEPRIKLNEGQKNTVRQKMIDAGIIATLTTTGAGIGALVGPEGAVIGGVVGAVLGLIVWFFS